MERMTAQERRETVAVIVAEGKLSTWHAQRWLSEVECRAKRLHKLYEGQCSEDLGTEGNAKRDAKVDRLEQVLAQGFAEAGLGLYLNGDPRGNPVGIHTPKTGKYNTIGGAECGWRL